MPAEGCDILTSTSPSSSGPGHRPFKATTRVRFPLGAPRRVRARVVCDCATRALLVADCRGGSGLPLAIIPPPYIIRFDFTYPQECCAEKPGFCVLTGAGRGGWGRDGRGLGRAAWTDHRGRRIEKAPRGAPEVLVGAVGLEPTILSAKDFKSPAYASSATPPHSHPSAASASWASRRRGTPHRRGRRPPRAPGRRAGRTRSRRGSRSPSGA